MTKYVNIVNMRTLHVLLIASITSAVVLRYNFNYNFDFTIISIAIIFPLVFTIRAAFRRREKAMEHLSRFKSGLLIVNYCFQANKKLEEGKKGIIKQVLMDISASLAAYLAAKRDTAEKNRKALDANLAKVFAFIQENRDTVKGGESFKIFRFMKDVHAGAENSIAIDTHRTPISLRAYCQIFIYVFPLIYTPALHHRLVEDGGNEPAWIVYMLSCITGFILISLFNVQDQMENPFDQEGLDDIRLKEFELKL